MKRNFRLTCLSFCALIITMVVCLFPQASLATPPENVQLKYSFGAQTLSVTVTHDTMLKGSHHVKFIEIKKNNSTVSINTYSEQPSGKTFTYNFKIPAIEEDTFSVTATCNMWGSKTSALLTVTP
ncbi:MAG: hypothetical protein K4571_00535 [Deltaproteobacteria bacterium]